MIKQSVKFFSIFIFCTIALAVDAIAQHISVDAIVLRVRGGVKMIEAGTEIAIKMNTKLSPDQIITTDNNGQLQISITDGSRVTVLPNSTIKLNDFRYMHSPRDLLTVLAGRIKVKINHPIGMPNPYKLSTPAASIAVRGTEFIVDVDANGSTSVFVIEGLVEVESISNPSNKRLLSTGEKAIIKLSGDISLNLPAGPGSELSGIPRSRQALDVTNRQMTEGVFMKSLGSTPVAFSAFPDIYADSSENPAYSANFRNFQGRISLLPSFARRGIYMTDNSGNTTYVPDANNQNNYNDAPSKWDNNINSQLSVYAPIFNSKMVVGGSLTFSRTNLRDYADTEGKGVLLDESFKATAKYVYKRHLDNNFKLSATKLTLSTALFLDKGKKTALGIAFNNITGKSNFLGVEESNSSIGYSYYNEQSIKSDLKGYDLTIGLIRDFSGGKILGLHTRLGTGKSDDTTYYRMSGIQTSCVPEPGNRRFRNNSHEVGLKWRSPLSKAFSYGIEGSYLYEDIYSFNIKNQTCYVPTIVADYALWGMIISTPDIFIPLTSDPSRRARIGGGLGYKLNSRTLLSLDMTGTHINSSKTVNQQPGNAATYLSPYPANKLKNTLYSFHAAVINNPWNQSVISFSLYRTPLYEYNKYDGKTFLPTFGAGWNFRSGAQIQYYASIDTSRGPSPSHSIMLRWNFDLKKEE